MTSTYNTLSKCWIKFWELTHIREPLHMICLRLELQNMKCSMNNCVKQQLPCRITWWPQSAAQDNINKKPLLCFGWLYHAILKAACKREVLVKSVFSHCIMLQGLDLSSMLQFSCKNSAGNQILTKSETRPFHLSLLDLMIWIILGERCKL